VLSAHVKARVAGGIALPRAGDCGTSTRALWGCRTRSRLSQAGPAPGRQPRVGRGGHFAHLLPGSVAGREECEVSLLGVRLREQVHVESGVPLPQPTDRPARRPLPAVASLHDGFASEDPALTRKDSAPARKTETSRLVTLSYRHCCPAPASHASEMKADPAPRRLTIQTPTPPSAGTRPARTHRRAARPAPS